jgi:hypothetical protein
LLEFASTTIVTPALGVLLTTCVLLAPAAQEEDPAARARATLQKVSKLPLDHQRVWLSLIEQRYGWAALLTLKPDDARLEQARVAKILRQKTVGWNELTLLLRQLDQREKAAIARLVRQYRAEVYETFHKQPREMVDRQDAWFRIWTAWETAGSPPEQQDRLMDWLAAAIKASGKDAISPLPPDPKFGEGVELVPEQLVKKLTQPAPAAAEARPDDLVPLAEIPVRGPLPLRVPDSRRAIETAKRPPDAIPFEQAGKMQGPLFGEAASTISQVAVSAAILPRLHVFVPLAADDPLELTAPPAAAHPATMAMIPGAGAVAATSPNRVVPDAIAGADSSPKPQPVGARRQPSEMPPARAVAPPPAQAEGGPAPLSVPPRSIVQADNGLGSENFRKPATPGGGLVLLPHKMADFATPRPPEYQVERKPLPAPASVASQPPSPPTTEQEPRAEVNIKELGTRIEGINLSLRNLEGDLHEKRDFTVDQLDALLSRLDILVLRQKDLTLFRDLVSPHEQAKLGAIDSPRPLVAAMGTRIAELRIRMRTNEVTPTAERTAALKHLDELSDRLATMTAEK